MAGDPDLRQTPPKARSLDGWTLALAGLVGALQALALVLIHAPRLEELAAHSRGVVEGHPYTIAFQNRLLGPSFVELLTSFAGVSRSRAFGVSLTIFSVAFALTSAVVFQRRTLSRRKALAYTLVSALAVVALQDDRWLFPWDLPDLVIFAVFAYGVLETKPVGFFLVLYALAMLNRESALLIPAWLVLSAFLRRRSEPKEALRWGLIGLVSIAVGLVYVKAVREALFAGPAAPYRLYTWWGNHLKLEHNFQDLIEAFKLGVVRDLVLYAVLLGVGSYFFVRRSRLDTNARSLLAVLGAVALAVVCFGLVVETRTWLIAVPLVAMLDCELRFGRDVSR